jgi:hypothetical protein
VTARESREWNYSSKVAWYPSEGSARADGCILRTTRWPAFLRHMEARKRSPLHTTRGFRGKHRLGGFKWANSKGRLAFCTDLSQRRIFCDTCIREHYRACRGGGSGTETHVRATRSFGRLNPGSNIKTWPFTLIGDPKKLFEASYAQVSEAIACPCETRCQTGDIRNEGHPNAVPL